LSKTKIDMMEPTRPVEEIVVRRIPSTQKVNGETSDIVKDFSNLYHFKKLVVQQFIHQEVHKIFNV